MIDQIRCMIFSLLPKAFNVFKFFTQKMYHVGFKVHEKNMQDSTSSLNVQHNHLGFLPYPQRMSLCFLQ
jgi:hypothetical protein